MLIVSQNLSNYDLPLPEDAVFRINLAWVSSLDELKSLLKKHKKHSIFLDLPVRRIKPPNYNYSMNDLLPILHEYQNIKYFAISNVESAEDLSKYLEIIPKDVTVVPKIENALGISNIKEITDKLHSQKVIMLDHDDLYSSLVKSNKFSSFKECVNELIDFCNANNITLLRTKGVIFGDDEKRVT